MVRHVRCFEDGEVEEALDGLDCIRKLGHSCVKRCRARCLSLEGVGHHTFVCFDGILLNV